MAEPAEVVVEGEVERVTFENDDTGFRVVKVALPEKDARLAVVGHFPRVAVGTRVRVRGELIFDKKHGEQLRAVSVTELAPATLVGIERYLGSGLLRGIGAVTAKKIVDTFGLDTLKVLDETPRRLTEVDGLGKKRVEQIADAWQAQRTIRDVMVFLQARGASPGLATRIFKRYGAKAIEVVSRDPYRLALDVWGVGFKTADRIAAELGIARDSPQRLQAGAWQSLHDQVEFGHTYVEEGELVLRTLELLGLDYDRHEKATLLAIAALVRDGHAATERVESRNLIAPANLFGAESRLGPRAWEVARVPATPLRRVSETLQAFESQTGVRLAPEQRRAVELAASNSLMVVTGGPGVGKTTLVRAILAVFDAAHLTTRLAAPTGRAAKRLQEATGREASTLHRLLEFEPKTASFRRGKDLPVEAGALIVDESSMVDIAMADALLQAVSPGTRLILVGDVDQLASVGPGAVLRDLIATDWIPTVRLQTIYRQANASLIVTNAHRINSGQALQPPEPGMDADFFLVERREPEAALRTVIELVTNRIPRKFGLDPLRDIQVLTPMHRGAAGSVALNDAIQAHVNPVGAALVRGNRTLRLADKVMQLRNDYDRGVWNGDVGTIVAVDEEEGTLAVSFDSKGEEPVVYDSGSVDDLTLAYACSIHKSQGSEYPAVVIVLLTSHFVMLSKNLLYTAVTRGKRLVVLVADPRAVSLALAADRRDERRTRLAERLRGATMDNRWSDASYSV